MLKLGVTVTENASELKGILTMYMTDASGNEHYQFQPGGLSHETKMPLPTYWIGKNRVVGGKEIAVALPKEVLDTEVEDEATGFKGKAVALYYHLNGCVHVDVKPKGTNEKTGEPLKAVEFDIRRLTGIAIKKLSEAQLQQSIKETPSPEPHTGLFDNK